MVTERGCLLFARKMELRSLRLGMTNKKLGRLRFDKKQIEDWDLDNTWAKKWELYGNTPLPLGLSRLCGCSVSRILIVRPTSLFILTTVNVKQFISNKERK